MQSEKPARSVVIIGAGIAGLSTGIYAQMNGYSSRIYELHNLPGGLMTAWKRKGYVIDGCIHWLTGSDPKSSYFPAWEEIGLIQGREMFNPEVFTRVEGVSGEVLNIYSNADRLEKHLLEIAPQDEKLIRRFCGAVRKAAKFNPPLGGSGGFLTNLLGGLRMLPSLIVALPVFRVWGPMTMREFGAQFTHPFLREAFSSMFDPEMTAAALVMTLGWLNNNTAGYPIGGSLPMAHAVEKRYTDLGGEIYYNCRVSKILVENGKAVGVRLEDGREERADVVISAADGHATIFDMLEGRYLDEKVERLYQETPMFPGLVFVGLGVNRTFPDFPKVTGGVTLMLDTPFEIGGEKVDRLDTMVYNFDPTLSPEGKTVLTVMIPSDYAYWKELASDRERYDAEKERVGIEVINRLEQRFAGLAGAVDMADVATPLTFERYTGNWQGSFEGWLPTPKTMMSSISKTLPGLENFYMVGQWVQAGGGLPSGVITAREVIGKMCKKDGRQFTTRRD